MKVPVKTEAWIPGVKLGIVRLGRAAGKVKYTLLDEPNIVLVQHYSFDAKIIIDKDGGGARIYAYMYEINKGRCIGQFLQDMLWEQRFGGIAPGFKVLHKNGITMDNRMENLCLVPDHVPDHGPLSCDSQRKMRESTLYWTAMQELPPDYVIEEIALESGKGKNFLQEADEDVTYYECHFVPCTNLEKEPREFSICGRCQAARYCGSFCQQRDWPNHKTRCKEKPLSILQDRFPER